MGQALFTRIELGHADVARIGAEEDVIVGAAEDPGFADELDRLGFVARFFAQLAGRGLSVGFSVVHHSGWELDEAGVGTVSILLDDEELAVAFADDDGGVVAFAAVVIDLAAVGEAYAIEENAKVRILVDDLG